MTQNENSPTSFQGLEPRDILCADKIVELEKVDKSCNQESWCVAWAPDCSYIAWSQGGGIVYLLPWAPDQGQLLKKPTRDQSHENLSEIEESAFIDNLPRLSPADDTENEDDFSWNENPGPSCQQHKMEAQRFRIDCMDYVWSMTFGSGVSRSNCNVRRRFSFNSDLILLTGLQGGKIKVWNVYTGNLIMELLDHKSNVHGLTVMCNGSLKLASCSADCTIKCWDLNNDGNMYKTLRFKENVMVFDCKYSPTCKQLAAVGMNKCAYVWNLSNLNSPRKLTGHLHNVVHCDFSPDGALLATASFDTRVILWDPYTGDKIKTLGHMFPSPRPIYAGGANEHYARCVSFSKHGYRIATVADDGYVRVWSLESLSENPVDIAETRKPLCCSYSSNGHVIATGNRAGKIEIIRPQHVEVARLQHMCRMKIRQRVQETQQVDHLHFPFRLKEYLKYKEL
ncbi:WD repeat and SOCS box-containing protein 1-like [Mercenaria mercenaria]|uniref:WD repeat and SOCS box-containing protein 1-like n=1 Tax=Mercenaria mercenaria TaxID=6596 RepID=UPI001E1DA435|nr:WD repeat and SOCS box-containing protein 1-like [Mercenaria mercenaria]